MSDIETPEEDAVEQAQDVAEHERAVPVEPSIEADEGDLAESSLEVPLDEDEYR
jgi:hypothetical protein